ncbi:MAG: outer-membrane lipoprotein carrier protein LolA [Clostridiales bacterium]|jgi:outer membrane lipoprotein-sorting protein|nr:outer-membrane lipoprotein carrier protein LolA [Clostridiales bacterium]
MRGISKIFLGLGALALALLPSGCGKPEEGLSMTAYERIQKNLVEMKSYQAEAAVTYISNKNRNEYQTFQQCRSTGEYRVAVTAPENLSGNITVSDGSTISQFNPKVSGKVSVTSKEMSERLEIFVTSFVKNYLNSEQAAVENAEEDGVSCTALSAKIPGENHYLSAEKLWVSNESHKPVKLVVYDREGGERILVKFSNFEYNVNIDDSVFTVGG